MNKAEKEHISKVISLGCIICAKPAEAHHIRKGAGIGMRSSHFNVIPLCPSHHRLGGYGVAYHAGRHVWEESFGTELELLKKVKQRLEFKEGTK